MLSNAIHTTGQNDMNHLEIIAQQLTWGMGGEYVQFPEMFATTTPPPDPRELAGLMYWEISFPESHDMSDTMQSRLSRAALQLTEGMGGIDNALEAWANEEHKTHYDIDFSDMMRGFDNFIEPFDEEEEEEDNAIVVSMLPVPTFRLNPALAYVWACQFLGILDYAFVSDGADETETLRIRPAHGATHEEEVELATAIALHAREVLYAFDPAYIDGYQFAAPTFGYANLKTGERYIQFQMRLYA
jgi:hypothetical protein